MPDVLNALVAFVAEHQRCGDLDGGRDDGKVWIACSCGAQIVQPASTAAEVAVAPLMPAVQDLIGKIIVHPDFAGLLRCGTCQQE
jgi:hypothetical protein